jgi:hypothetical protein
MINLFGRKVPTTKRKVEEEEEDSSIEEIQPVKKKARSEEPISQPVVPAPKPIISVPKPSPIVNSVDESIWKGRLQGKDKEITELKRQLADLQQENMRITSESQKKIEEAQIDATNRLDQLKKQYKERDDRYSSMQKELQNKAVQVDNLEKENDQLMSKLAELMRKEKNHEENMKQTRQAMQNEINLLNSRLTNIQKSLEHQIREKEDLTRQLRIKEGMVTEEQKKAEKRDAELLRSTAEKESQLTTLKNFVVKFESHFTTVHLNLFAARDSTRSSSATEVLAVRHQLILMNLLHDFFESQSKKVKDIVQFAAKTRIPIAATAPGAYDMRIQGNFDGPLIRAILAPFDLKSFYVDEQMAYVTFKFPAEVQRAMRYLRRSYPLLVVVTRDQENNVKMEGNGLNSFSHDEFSVESRDDDDRPRQLNLAQTPPSIRKSVQTVATPSAVVQVTNNLVIGGIERVISLFELYSALERDLSEIRGIFLEKNYSCCVVAFHSFAAMERTLARLRQQYPNLEIDKYDRICESPYDFSCAKLAMRNVTGSGNEVSAYINDTIRGTIKECDKIGETSFEICFFDANTALRFYQDHQGKPHNTFSKQIQLFFIKESDLLKEQIEPLKKNWSFAL